ncbi:MAG: methylmalonyl Co-A mutase-associated GTPase MeaB [Spirosomataceae bacterium]
MALHRLAANQYIDGILAGNRVILSRAITLVESLLPSDRTLASEVVQKLLPYSGKSVRIGITGVPGVGKSTFIENFGQYLTQKGHKVAVLAIDPTSQRTKGSIMGDKTRMEMLSHDPNAFVRPSPSGQTLGGVAQKTRESMLLCEAAGYDIILVETVGVGQSETAVRDMVDFFLLLLLAGAGDELQGIKKGIMEMADALVVHKADGDNITKAKLARLDYQNALHLFPPQQNQWFPPVLLCSSLQKTGHAEIWETILTYQKQTQENGFWEDNRQRQKLEWMKTYLHDYLIQQFMQKEGRVQQIKVLEKQVLADQLTPIQAVHKLLDTPTSSIL